MTTKSGSLGFATRRRCWQWETDAGNAILFVDPRRPSTGLAKVVEGGTVVHMGRRCRPYLLPKRNGAERTRVFHANLTQLRSTRAPGCRRGGPRGVSLIPISHQRLDGTRGAERRNAFLPIRLNRLDAREVDDTQRALGWAWGEGLWRQTGNSLRPANASLSAAIEPAVGLHSSSSFRLRDRLSCHPLVFSARVNANVLRVEGSSSVVHTLLPSVRRVCVRGCPLENPGRPRLDVVRYLLLAICSSDWHAILAIPTAG
ncbi:hypothetical protein R1flu_010744 [Riccia fluitans]|uniref:Uncharacterized protein n=1 Tax=Riccia fluitans TaxID=41844 RepID=A0ABD1ZA04_9MARC